MNSRPRDEDIGTEMERDRVLAQRERSDSTESRQILVLVCAFSKRE